MENLAFLTLASPIPSPIPQTESDLSLVVVGSTPFSPMNLFSVENSVAAASAATIQMSEHEKVYYFFLLYHWRM